MTISKQAEITDKVETRTVKTPDNQNENDLALFRLFKKIRYLTGNLPSIITKLSQPTMVQSHHLHPLIPASLLSMPQPLHQPSPLSAPSLMRAPHPHNSSGPTPKPSRL
jgi:hypothetical protein